MSCLPASHITETAGNKNEVIIVPPALSVGRVQPRCPHPYCNATVSWAASVGARGGKS